MTRKEFNKIIQKFTEERKSIQDSKGEAYSGQKDALGNFKRGAKLTGSNPMQVWFIYFMKHVDAVASYVRGEYKDTEAIDGRLADLANYIELAYGLVKESGKEN